LPASPFGSGGNFNDSYCVPNFVPSLSMKDYWKSITI